MTTSGHYTTDPNNAILRRQVWYPQQMSSNHFECCIKFSWVFFLHFYGPISHEFPPQTFLSGPFVNSNHVPTTTLPTVTPPPRCFVAIPLRLSASRFMRWISSWAEVVAEPKESWFVLLPGGGCIPPTIVINRIIYIYITPISRVSYNPRQLPVYLFIRSLKKRGPLTSLHENNS